MCNDPVHYYYFFGRVFLSFFAFVQFQAHFGRGKVDGERERDRQTNAVIVSVYFSVHVLVFVHASDFHEHLHTIHMCLYHTSASATAHINRQVPSFIHLCIVILLAVTLPFCLFYSLACFLLLANKSWLDYTLYVYSNNNLNPRCIWIPKSPSEHHCVLSMTSLQNSKT